MELIIDRSRPFTYSYLQLRRQFIFHLIEGLNCSGKSTYIDSAVGSGMSLTTSWMNPLRWSKNKKKIIVEDLEINPYMMNPYAIGAYETLMKTLIPMSYNLDKNIFWDRTFVSAYVYKSISKKVYDFLVEVMYELNEHFLVELVLLDTPVEVCLERLMKLREKNPDYKGYAWADNKADMMRVQQKFYEVLSQLTNHGFVLKTI